MRYDFSKVEHLGSPCLPSITEPFSLPFSFFLILGDSAADEN